MENIFKKLKNIWLRSDSQPTEITLALANLTMINTSNKRRVWKIYLKN